MKNSNSRKIRESVVYFGCNVYFKCNVNTQEVFGYICEMLIYIKFTTAPTSSDTIGQDVNDYCDLMRSQSMGASNIII